MEYYVRESINFMGQFNNIIQFLITCLSLGALLVVIFYKSYRKILFELFQSSGIHNGTVFKILWVCRKNVSVKIRHFCEFAILKSEGRFLSKLAWDQLVHDFSKSDIPQNGRILTENALLLQKDEVIKLIDKYFLFFRDIKNRKKFKIYNNDLSFVSQIEIQDGYISPITRIRGLQERFCDDWKMIIDSYSHFSKIGNSPSEELYMFYTCKRINEHTYCICVG